MSIIRYQPPETVAWSGLNRLSNLRDELDTLGLRWPFWSDFGGQSQLFSGWSPALDLYQNNDNVVVRVELPGMHKEDIEISLQDGMLTISGERKSENRRRRESRGGLNAMSANSAAAFRCRLKSDASKVTATYRDGILNGHSAQSGMKRSRKQIQVNGPPDQGGKLLL